MHVFVSSEVQSLLTLLYVQKHITNYSLVTWSRSMSFSNLFNSFRCWGDWRPCD